MVWANWLQQWAFVNTVMDLRIHNNTNFGDSKGFWRWCMTIGVYSDYLPLTKSDLGCTCICSYIEIWMTSVRFLAGARDISLLQRVQTGPGPTRFPIQWVTGAPSQGVKLTTHLYLVPKSGMVELHLHSPIRLHGTVFNSLRIGTTLRFTFYILTQVCSDWS
jgi:hypothetical protein